jgi:hypothetical protein
MTECASGPTRFPALVKLPTAVTPQERERMNWLCNRIQDEKDPEKFDELVHALNALLEAKHERIHPEHKTNRLA